MPLPSAPAAGPDGEQAFAQGAPAASHGGFGGHGGHGGHGAQRNPGGGFGGQFQGPNQPVMVFTEHRDNLFDVSPMQACH
jgi:hypothetical protein